MCIKPIHKKVNKLLKWLLNEMWKMERCVTERQGVMQMCVIWKDVLFEKVCFLNEICNGFNLTFQLGKN